MSSVNKNSPVKDVKAELAEEQLEQVSGGEGQLPEHLLLDLLKIESMEDANLMLTLPENRPYKD